MLIKLKENLGAAKPGAVVSVSSKRAYNMMVSGIAVRDASFMVLYEESNGVKPKEAKTDNEFDFSLDENPAEEKKGKRGKK